MSRTENRSLAEQAYDELERRLVTLELGPGQFLLEKELSKTLGLGRTPVREAVQRLAAHGLLKILSQMEPVEDEFPNVDDNVLPLDDVDL